MKEYLEIANHPAMYLGVALLLGIVLWQSAVYIRRALKRAGELGIAKDRLRHAVRVAALTSIVPSIAIVVALLTLAPVLGLPFSWARLSIIGSLSYELMAAEIGAAASGAALGGAGYGAGSFLTSVCVMTVGSFVTLSLTIFGFKWYKNRLDRSIKKSGTGTWGKVLMAALIVSLYSRFLAAPVVEGGTALLSMAVSAVSMLLLNLLIKKGRGFRWLSDFSLSVSMVLGMTAAVLCSL